MEIQQRDLGTGESTAGVTYLSMRIHPKGCYIFSLKFATTVLSSSRKFIEGSPDVY